MIIIITHTNNPFKLEFWKSTLGKIFKRNRGPRAVLNSVLRGFGELKIQYKLNPLFIPKNSTVLVLSGVSGLKTAIKNKGQKISKLIAGPNVVENPTNHNSIILDPKIDFILVPSLWVKNLYAKYLDEKFPIDKIKIWPAGVKINQKDNQIKNSEKQILIYKKDCPEEIYKKVIEILEKKKLKSQEIIYGNFNQQEYFEKLNTASLVIYLQKVESQGLAMFESWSKNIPTLVWESGKYYFPKYDVTVEGKVSAPYLDNQCGLPFYSTEDFEETLDMIIEKKEEFQPQKFIESNFSDKISAQKLLGIING